MTLRKVWLLLAAAVAVAAFVITPPTSQSLYVTPEQVSPAAACSTPSAVASAADSTVAIQAALNTGKLVSLHGCFYKITQSVACPLNAAGASWVGIVGPGGLYGPAANFTHNTISGPGRYGSDAVFVNCSGVLSGGFAPNHNVVLRDFILQSEVSQGRKIFAVAILNAQNVVIENLEAFGFPVGVGIAVASVLDSLIIDNHIHDFTDNSVWSELPQITGIEVDNDLVNSTPSRRLVISRNRIHDITVGATLLAAWNYQTDGINLANTSGTPTTGLIVADNSIYNVGEGIDNYASYGVISGNRIDKTYLFGLKLIHGATGNTVVGNTIHNAGLAGISIAGTTVGPIGGNTVSANTISGIDPDNINSASTTGCIEVVDNAGTNYPSNNKITDNLCNPGPHGKWAFFDTSHGTGNDVSFQIVAAGSSGVATVTNGGSFVRARMTANGPSYFLITNSGTSSAVTGTYTPDSSEIEFAMIGGAGGGAGIPTGANTGASGTTGVFVSGKMLVVPGTGLPYSIGQAGAGGVAGNNAGATGGDTTFNGVTAKGGIGGGSAASGNGGNASTAQLLALQNSGVVIPTETGTVLTSRPNVANGTSGAGAGLGGVGTSSAWGVGGAAGNGSAGGNATGQGASGGGAGSTSNGAWAGGNASGGALFVRSMQRRRRRPVSRSVRRGLPARRITARTDKAA